MIKIQIMGFMKNSNMEVSDRPKIRKYYKLKMQKNLNKKFYMIFEFEKYINNIN